MRSATHPFYVHTQYVLSVCVYVCVYSMRSDLSLDKVVIFEVLIFKRCCCRALRLRIVLYECTQRSQSFWSGARRAFMLDVIPDAISTVCVWERER